MSTYKQQLHEGVSLLDKKTRISFITAEFNKHYTSQLEEVTATFLQQHGFENITKYHVPGAFELPGMANRILKKDYADLIFCFGVVIKGETPHFDYVCGECARGITNLSLIYTTPIIFGVLTCNNDEQVLPRINNNFAIAGLNLLASVENIV